MTVSHAAKRVVLELQQALVEHDTSWSTAPGKQDDGLQCIDLATPLGAYQICVYDSGEIYYNKGGIVDYRIQEFVKRFSEHVQFEAVLASLERGQKKHEKLWNLASWLPLIAAALALMWSFATAYRLF